MAHTYHKLWIHLIWSTKDRAPLLVREMRGDLLAHIRETAPEKGIHLDALNGTADHLHGLVSLSPEQSIARVVNDLKGESSHWVNAQRRLSIPFAWERGYSAFSYAESQVPKVREYIRNQETHHRKMTFQEELTQFLKRFHVDEGRP